MEIKVYIIVVIPHANITIWLPSTFGTTCCIPRETTIQSWSYLFMELTLGTFSWSHTPSANSLSRISQANIVGFSLLYLHIESTTFGVATFGLEPPITPGLMEPVS